MNSTQISKLVRDRSVLLAFFDLLFLALPGILMLYELHLDFFLTLDWIKLILLATSFVLPLAFVNTLVVLWSFEENPNAQDDDFFLAFSLGSIFAGLVFFGALAIRHFSSPYTQNFFASATIFEVAVVFWIAVEKFKLKKSKK